MLLLLFIFLSFIGRLGILGESGHKGHKNLRIISAIYLPLDLDFVCNSMSWSIFLKTILISFSYIETRS